MPTIIDSLFLELGIDVSKFSKDQQAALAKISQFEVQTKRAAGNARSGIKSVGDAFRDLAKESKIGASATQVDNLAKKFKALGVSMGAAGGAGAPLGAMARGLGMLLSPASLGIAAVAMLAKETWDFNEVMTASNATLARNAELSNMSAKNLWAMGMAAKTVGGDPAQVQAGIASLQTSLAGASIGVGSAVPQMIGMARLHRYGAHYNPGGFGKGVDEESLFKAVNAYYQQNGRAKTTALVTGYGLMSADQANLAMSPTGWKEYQDAQAKAKAMKTGGGFEAVVTKSLQSQVGLGEKDIAGAIAAETAYGGVQGGMQTIVGLVTNIYGVLTGIFNFLVHPVSNTKKAYDATVEGASRMMDDMADAGHLIKDRMLPNAMRSGMSHAMQFLMSHGISEDDAAAQVGSMMRESSMNPLAVNATGHRGIMQWNKARQAAFAKWSGYQMGSSGVSADQQFNDQLGFNLYELQGPQRAAAIAMAKARDLMGKTSAFMNIDERPGDGSLAQRFGFAQQAMRLADVAGMVSARSSQHTVSNDTRIGDVHIHTPSTDPQAHADAFRNGIASQPLLNIKALGQISLGTRAMQ